MTSAAQSGSVPQLEGPYAGELEEAYRNSASDFFRAAVADGKITDTEYYEAQERAKSCLEDNGFTGVMYDKNGGSSTAERTDIDEDEEVALHQKCEATSGLADTEIWYFALNANPDNLDWPSAERDCLVRAGLLEAGTSVDEMNQWYANGGVGSRSHAAYVCSQDALGHLGLQ